MLSLLAAQLLGKRADLLDDAERRVLLRIAENWPDAGQTAPRPDNKWDHLADRVARIGGSWPFIFSFLALLVGWMLLNTDVLAHWDAAFDPYPYIFLNLMLSMVAALQAPIIMMSQNRSAAQDRRAAAEDYAVNLKAEVEIMNVHARLDEVLALLAQRPPAAGQSPPSAPADCPPA